MKMLTTRSASRRCPVGSNLLKLTAALKKQSHFRFQVCWRAQRCTVTSVWISIGHHKPARALRTASPGSIAPAPAILGSGSHTYFSSHGLTEAHRISTTAELDAIPFAQLNLEGFSLPFSSYYPCFCVTPWAFGFSVTNACQYSSHWVFLIKSVHISLCI